MRKFYFALTLFFSITIFSCSHKVTRIEPTETPDINGSWNNTDSRLTAEEMIKQCLGEAWLANYTDSKSKKPVVIVGMVVNKKNEHFYFTGKIFLFFILKKPAHYFKFLWRFK